MELTGRRGTVPVSVAVSLSGNEPKRARLDGAVLRSAEQLRAELTTLVFTPDRLVVVKGGPAARRAYIDRSLGRLYPARAHISLDYAAALGQRNAALRRVAMGVSHRDALAPWTAQVADLGTMLTAARRDVVDLLQPWFAERAGELGLACDNTKTCVALFAAGAPCSNGDQCAYGLGCAGLPSTCKAFPKLGEPCPDGACTELGAACKSGTCTAYGFAGAACTMNPDCSPYYLTCSATQATGFLSISKM